MILGFKILLLQRILSYNFKDEIFIYWLFEFSVIYSIQYVNVPVGKYVWLFPRIDKSFT